MYPDLKNQMLIIKLCIYLAKCALIILLVDGEYKNLTNAGSLLERCRVK